MACEWCDKYPSGPWQKKDSPPLQCKRISSSSDPHSLEKFIRCFRSWINVSESSGSHGTRFFKGEILRSSKTDDQYIHLIGRWFTLLSECFLPRTSNLYRDCRSKNADFFLRKSLPWYLWNSSGKGRVENCIYEPADFKYIFTRI